MNVLTYNIYIEEYGQIQWQNKTVFEKKKPDKTEFAINTSFYV